MSVAVVILAHDKPGHLHRLVKALDGLPIFLHVDAGTSPEMHHEMTDGLPQRVRLLPRVSSGWASFGLVEAELTSEGRQHWSIGMLKTYTFLVRFIAPIAIIAIFIYGLA